jgi:hypothetical protein
MFFPSTAPEHVALLLDILQSLDYPFLLCLGGQIATGAVPADKISSINASGKGWIQNSWVDQQAILQHPSINFFLGHGGWNGISESMAQGVPMILWPLAQSDQAGNAALLSLRQQPVGFELLQIRQGWAKAKAWRTGEEISGKIEDVEKEFRDILEKTRGGEGEVLRNNAKELAKQLREEKDGKADKIIQEIACI